MSKGFGASRGAAQRSQSPCRLAVQLRSRRSSRSMGSARSIAGRTHCWRPPRQRAPVQLELGAGRAQQRRAAVLGLARKQLEMLRHRVRHARAAVRLIARHQVQRGRKQHIRRRERRGTHRRPAHTHAAAPNPPRSARLGRDVNAGNEAPSISNRTSQNPSNARTFPETPARLAAPRTGPGWLSDGADARR